jgi:pectinesterase
MRRAALIIYGYTNDTSSYVQNVVVIIHASSIASGAADDKSTGTVINNAANTKFYNINIKNSYGEGSQAIALSAYGSEQGYYGVGLYGYQDTLLAQTGAQLYAKCYIEGAVDFIFGQEGQVWIDGSDIAVSGEGSITASGRKSSSSSSFYVINQSAVAATSSASVISGSVYLGRPWSQYARVAVQHTALGMIINGAGWDVWTTGDMRISNVLFYEFGNTGPGASGTRASFSQKLSSPISINTVLGGGYTDWVDGAYLS